ncbi:MAG: RNA polymerase sigma-I factor [Bacillota bacterium]
MKRTPHMVNTVLTLKMTKQVEEQAVEARVARARDGDIHARDDLIRDYSPFILKTAASSVKRYVVLGEDDEASIALSAFNEAIDAFKSKRPGFLAFAATVIRRRLIDYYRKQSRQREIPYSTMDATGAGRNEQEAFLDPSCLTYTTEDWQAVVERRDDIENWKDTLKQFGLTISQVVQAAPKHQDARERAMYMARCIAKNAKLRRLFFKTRKIPIGELLAHVPENMRVSKKTIERQKVYITAVAIAMSGDYPSMEGYFDVLDREW